MTNNDQRGAQDSTSISEAEVLSTLVSALAKVEQPSRLRLFRTLCTFFDLPFFENGARDGSPEKSYSQSGTAPYDSPFSEDRTQSPKAFLLEKRPQTDIERVACLAYYITHYRDQPKFKTFDLSKLNTEAAQIKFSNPTRAVDKATVAQLLIPAGGGLKAISAIGEVYVQALPDKAAAKAAIANLKRKRTRTRGRQVGGDADPSELDIMMEDDANGDES